jgi:hypothetical protein
VKHSRSAEGGLAPADEVGLLPDIDIDFDDVTDVICAGSGPGALAYAVACAELGLEVLVVDSANQAEFTDEETVNYLRSMTEDLGAADSGPVASGGIVPGSDLHLASVRASEAEPTPGRHRLEPFVGHRLRDWSVQCTASVFGLLCTTVPDAVLSPFRTDDGELIEVGLLGRYQPRTDLVGEELVGWLMSQADEHDIELDTGLTLQRLIFHDEQVVGAVVVGSGEPRLVRAVEGVVLSVPVPLSAHWPAQPELRGTSAQVAIVSRKAGRFARIELLPED